jgi:transcriptional regulator with XRE-family HTH domain
LLEDLGVWLRGQRLARGWAVADMARHLRHAGKETGDNHLPGTATLAAYIRRWERGVIAPSERYQLLYGAALGIPPGEFGPGQSHQRPPGSADSSGSISRRAVAGVPGDSPRVSRARASSGYRACRKEHNAARQLGQPAPAATSLDQLMVVIADESLELVLTA